ncbi:MAG: hypothetical protein F6J98_33945 [Moorea sp. SIO4G2]|uniref:hypothetical protein n=1 Tax=unclassified Moorena TaxID=2683338 RepID=UPI0013FCAD0E|nr:MULTISPECIES: hypothetical protein [unclassified Moorena]NEO17752.1 hypothetical protein [Moorena sp. SIO3E8]NEO65130.1 hypothetical protein [Moorena sp. SIO4G2]NEQ04304.1 hypothetical protein [Moorena sp. SIO3F7]
MRYGADYLNAGYEVEHEGKSAPNAPYSYYCLLLACLLPEVFPIPDSRFPIPYSPHTPHPTPHTLLPTPCSLFPDNSSTFPNKPFPFPE